MNRNRTQRAILNGQCLTAPRSLQHDVTGREKRNIRRKAMAQGVEGEEREGGGMAPMPTVLSSGAFLF